MIEREGCGEKMQGSERFKISLSLLAFTCLANVLILANPGFFNHDEWQKYDSLSTYDFAEYIRQYGQLRAGPDFGFPVRPLGFIQQGISALFMHDFPFVAHAIDVLIHAAVVLVLWHLLLICLVDRRRATWAAGLFAISPLTVLSTGWVGASFDRWYVLFSLLCACVFVRAIRDGVTWWRSALLFLASAAAITSKETSVMLPVMLAGLYLFLCVQGQCKFELRAPVLALGSVSLPILVYLIIRMPALYASFFSGTHGAYAPSSGNLLANLKAYFAQPFLMGTVDLASSKLLPSWVWALALGFHVLVTICLALRCGLKVLLFYVFGYLVFLLPVLPVPIQGAHYLYASAIPFSLALVYALLPSRTDKVLRYAGLLLPVAFLWAHSAEMQTGLYSFGQCQRRFLDTLDTHLSASELRGRGEVDLVIEPGALGYLALQSTFARSPYTGARGFKLAIHDGSEIPAGGADQAVLIMRKTCQVEYR